MAEEPVREPDAADLALLERLSEGRRALESEIGKRVIGQERIVEGLLTALLADGHALVVGVPGLAKTLLISTLARALDLAFSRIQVTPDLMPSDITGTEILEEDRATGKRMFRFVRGPIFANVVLADEINRTPPKTQAALLQAMQERAVTAAGETMALDRPFFVLATQNPIEQEGTYPLPEAQLDRFLFKVDVPYPSRDEERRIVKLHGNRTAMPDLDDFGLETLADADTLKAARAVIRELTLSDEVVDYIVDLTRATRTHNALMHGASPRASNMLAMASRALAGLRGRAYVIPDDVKGLFVEVMRHRVLLTPAAEVEGLGADPVLRQILESTPAPR